MLIVKTISASMQGHEIVNVVKYEVRVIEIKADLQPV